MSDAKRQKKVDSSPKVALITGITGQDGSYLAELLLNKGYEVHGIIRRSSSFNTGRIEELYQDPHVDTRKLILHYGDLTDSTNCFEIVSTVRPDELYNLGAQSHVKVSFEMSEYTADADGMGVLRLLNAIRSTSTERVQELLGLRADNTPLTQEERPGPRADPKSLTKLGTPALAFAAQRFLDGSVEAFLAAGADPHLTKQSGSTALDYAVQCAAEAPPGAAAVARTLALLEGPTLGCPRAEHAAKLTVGAAVTWTDTAYDERFPEGRLGTVVKEPDKDGDLTVEGASGGVGWFKPEDLRLREGA